MSSMKCRKAPKKRSKRPQQIKEKLTLTVGLLGVIFILACIVGIAREVIHHL